MIEFVEQQSAEAFDAFVAGHPKGHFMQAAFWGKVKQDWTWKGVISRSEGGDIRGVMALLVRKVPIFPASILYAPRGPVCDAHDEETFLELTEGAKQVARAHRGYVIKMDPDILSSDEGFLALSRKAGFVLPADSKNFEAVQPRYVFRLYLEGRGEEEIMAAFHSKTRYNIRVAQKKGVEVRLMGKEALDDFHRIMLVTGVRDGFVIRSKSYFARMLEVLGEHARLYMAYLDGEAVAGTLAVHYGDKVWYLYGASANEARNAMPNYLLQWEMIRWSIELGCRIYDFRGVSGDLSEDNPLYGLYRFKKGFSGDFTEFVGEMNLVLRPMMYRLIELSQRSFRSARKVLFLWKNRDKRRGG